MVSIAVPVKRSFVEAVPFSLQYFEGDVEAAVARLVAHDGGLHAAGVGGVEPDIAGIAVEGQAEIGGFAEAVLALQRARDLLLDVLALDGAGKPRHRNLLDVPGVDADHLVRPQRVEDMGDRQRAGGAEIRRAVDRDLRRTAGVVDDVADPHQIARHGDAGAQHRCGDDVVAVLRLREARRSRSAEQRGGEEKGAGDHG